MTKKKATVKGKIKDGDIKEERLKRYLKYGFTEEEIKNLGSGLAKTVSDRLEAEGRLKSATTQIKSEIALHDASMSSLAEKIRSGYEHRDVECKKEFNYRTGTVTVTRLDTGEELEMRPMEGEERQRELPLIPEGE